jgi:hypothetical protein
VIHDDPVDSGFAHARRGQAEQAKTWERLDQRGGGHPIDSAAAYRQRWIIACTGFSM